MAVGQSGGLFLIALAMVSGRRAQIKEPPDLGAEREELGPLTSLGYLDFVLVPASKAEFNRLKDLNKPPVGDKKMRWPGSGL